MAIQAQPSRIPEPFAGSGTKNTIPATNSTPSASQAASWASGFPPECSQPISAGGCPVPRNDMNGALNWLSQDFSFRQDGGIWSWSALADYDSGRFVRGSDGSFYKSAAQSGPATVAGAKNPTADDGTYWIKMPSMADMSSWVHGTVDPATIYVDYASGNDANDGLSSGSRVKTIAHALDLAQRRFGARHYISLGNGASYAENIEIGNQEIVFILEGNVSLSGVFRAINSRVYIDGSDKTLRLDINNPSRDIVIDSVFSHIEFNCAIEIYVYSGTVTSLFYSDYLSNMTCDKNITVYNAVNIESVFASDKNSHISLDHVSLALGNGEKITNCIATTYGGSGQALYCSFTSNTIDNFLFSNDGSFTFYGCNFNNVSAYNAVNANYNSCINIIGGCYGYLKADAGGYCVFAGETSVVRIFESSVTLACNTASPVKSFVYALLGGLFSAIDSTVALSGSASNENVAGVHSAILYVPADTTVSLSVSGTQQACRLANGSLAITGSRATLFGPNGNTVGDYCLYK